MLVWGGNFIPVADNNDDDIKTRVLLADAVRSKYVARQPLLG